VSPSNRMKAVFFLRLPQLEVAALEQHKDFINSRSHFDQGQRHETNLIYWPSKDVTRTSKRRRNKIEKRQRNVENVMAIRQKCPRNVEKYRRTTMTSLKCRKTSIASPKGRKNVTEMPIASPKCRKRR